MADDHQQRVAHLLDQARFVTLATHDGTTPWASTVNYVVLREPLRLIWSSMAGSRHSRNIVDHPRVSGSIFMTGLPGFGIDGLQFDGTARSIEDVDEAGELHETFYRLNFPDPELRQQMHIPVEDHCGEGLRRLYVLTIERCWLLDIDRWLQDKTDQRVEVKLSAEG